MEQAWTTRGISERLQTFFQRLWRILFPKLWISIPNKNWKVMFSLKVQRGSRGVALCCRRSCCWGTQVPKRYKILNMKLWMWKVLSGKNVKSLLVDQDSSNGHLGWPWLCLEQPGQRLQLPQVIPILALAQTALKVFMSGCVSGSGCVSKKFWSWFLFFYWQAHKALDATSG